MEIPPVWTLAELGKLMCMSKYRVQTQLRWANIKPHRVGNKFVIYLHQLEAHHPELFKSIEAQLRARRITRSLELLAAARKAP